MTDRWDRLRALFDQALELPAEDRSDFLVRSCDDPALRAEVASLLAAAAADGPLDAIAPRLMSLHDVLAERVPEQVGPYAVTGVIGEGGMAVVYRAHDPRLRRDVALKFLPVSLHDHSPAADRLMAEARTASALDHPNICTIYDIASVDDRIFIAMAYYGGGTLQDRLHAGPLPIADALRIAGQVADALECAHAAGIVHRDVKPANIAFGDRGEVKVLDFGVAVLADGDGDDAVRSAGTPLYMSPEQVRGDGTDARSDVWALGVVLFEMLTGERPFVGDSRDAVHEHILRHEPARVSTLRHDVPESLSDAVARALAKDAAGRFQTAAEMGAALAAVSGHAAAPASRGRSAAFRAAAAIVLLLSAAAVVRMRPEAQDGPPAGDALLEEQLGRGRERFYSGTSEGNEAAIAIFRSVIERDSTHAVARSFLAAAYAISIRPDFSRSGRTEWLDSARTHANIAVALAPGEPATHAALGVVERWSGRLDEAVEHHRRALALDPRYAQSMLETGYINHLMGRPDDAALWLERGLAIEPDVPAARQYATALYRAFDMPDEAHRHLMAGRTIAPDDASLVWETVMLALDAGATDIARREFDAYIQLVPAGERERMRAWYYILAGDPTSALSHIDRADLTDAPVYDLRAFGTALLQAGDRERGRALLRRALDDIAATADVPDWGYDTPDFYTAHIHAALGDTEASIAALERWDANGGISAWRRTDPGSAWSSVAGDARFIGIVQRSSERFGERRARLAAELSRVRD